ncbi:MAG: META domain-containing protein [Sphingomonadaceae bacterium]|nr:META domain-containing protein [Sphingomonadaceae bacterium]
MKITPTLFLAAMALSTGACATMPSASSPALAGTEWRFTAIDGAAPAVPDRAELRFEADRMGANVGCNGMGGDWRLDGSTLITGPLISTQMYCEGPVWDQERAVSALLAGKPEVQRAGDRLVLTGAGHRAELVLAGE